jgi:hypothetical protein
VDPNVRLESADTRAEPDVTGTGGMRTRTLTVITELPTWHKILYARESPPPMKGCGDLLKRSAQTLQDTCSKECSRTPPLGCSPALGPDGGVARPPYLIPKVEKESLAITITLH